MTKQNFVKYQKYGLVRKLDIEVVEDTINILIDNLYKPCEDERVNDGIDMVIDGEKLKKWDMDNEPINWGDLKVCDVTKEDDTFFVTIDEAAPGCYNFIQYIEHFMTLWGWNVRVQTEW